MAGSRLRNASIDREVIARVGVSTRARVNAWYAGLARHERLLWAVVAGALIADTALTVLGVRYGLAEGNPFVRAALVTVGPAGIVVMKAAALATGLFYRRQCPRFGPAIALGLALPWAIASVVNAMLIAGAV